MNTKHNGLTQAEIEQRLEKFGKNKITDLNQSSALKILLRQIKKNFIVYLLTATAITSFFLDKGLTGYVILAVIIIVVSTGFIQEYKAERTINLLRDMIMPMSRVIRNGKESEIPSEELVPDDIIILRTGERVPADCIVLEESKLRLNESILTGESSEVSKLEMNSADSPTNQNIVFMGSFVVNGKCIAKVQNTGMNTKFGEIASMIGTAEKQLPLQNKVNNIAKYMIFVGLTAAILTGLVLFGRSDTITTQVVVNILIIIIALAVSSFPEGFPVVLTTALAVGVNRMAKQNAVVNRMSIIETLGETSIICSDKTGTITTGEMTVRIVYVNGISYTISGVGYESKGEVFKENKKIDITPDHPILDLIKVGVLCNDSVIEPLGDGDLYNIIGTPTEGAMLILGAKLNNFKDDYGVTRVEELPFDSNRKMMSTLYAEGSERYVYAMGASEVLLSKCSYFKKDGAEQPLTEHEKFEIMKVNRALTSRGLRCLAMGYKIHKSEKADYEENEFVFLGLAGMEDPPREEVKEAISLCFKSGITVKMITGDNSETAKAIASEIGLKGEVIEGKQVDMMNDQELSDAIKTTTIFSRVMPEHKLRIVRALKASGEIVTMTGDGINDAPALKEAHIGVAMGKNGTDVSRSAADITLKDDNFATIVGAIKEGRTVFNNIRKFMTYQLSCNLSDIIMLFIGMLLAPYLGWYVPIITALHILFINIVTDNIPAITLGFNPTSKDIMSLPPRKNAEILTRNHLLLIMMNGLVLSVISLVVTFASFNILDFTKEEARTTVLISIIAMQIAHAYNFRSFRFPVFTRSIFINKYLVWASLTSITLTTIIIYSPLNKFLETTPLGLISWIIALLCCLLIVLFVDVFKALNKRYKLVEL